MYVEIMSQLPPELRNQIHGHSLALVELPIPISDTDLFCSSYEPNEALLSCKEGLSDEAASHWKMMNTRPVAEIVVHWNTLGDSDTPLPTLYRATYAVDRVLSSLSSAQRVENREPLRPCH
jgi:hypothetical protein